MPSLDVVDEIIEIDAGETVRVTGVRMSDLPIGYIHPRLEPGPRLINAGELIVEPVRGPFGMGEMYGVYIDRYSGSFTHSSFWNTWSGVIRIQSADPGLLYGYYSGSGATPDFRNDGLFQVTGLQDAWGLYTFGPSATIEDYPEHSFEFTNTGRIEVTAGRNAHGVLLYNGGLAVNTGVIIATGTGAVTGMLSWSHRTDIFNSGSIIAIDTAGPDDSVGLTISAGVWDSIVVNTGLIRGATAIGELVPGSSFVPFPNGNDVVDNQGRLEGDVVFTYGDDTVFNSGVIVGDVVFAAGHDRFYGSRGRLDGQLVMGGGDDWGWTGGAHDVASGGDGDDELYGESGDDVLAGDAGDDLLVGGEGDDTLTGGAGRDVLIGGAGADILIGDGDLLLGGEGADLYRLGSGADVVILGADAGDDRVEQFDVSTDRFSVPGGFTAVTDTPDGARLQHAGGFVLVVGAAGLSLAQWNDRLVNPADGPGVLVGGIGDDVLTGGHVPDTLLGGDGDDHLTGGGGDDVLEGGSGYDRLEGGDGDDRLTDHGGGGLLLGEAGDDVLFGSDADDTLYGGLGGDTLIGGGGDDLLFGEEGADTVRGGAGDDRIYGGSGANALSGEQGDDWIQGGDDGELIRGGFGDDIIYGGSGNDLIYGDMGDDVLHGGDGDDTIDSFSGDDLVYGGAGRDIIRVGGLTAWAYGEDGNDSIDATQAGWAEIHGGAGDDNLSAASYGATFGGDGNDTLTGSNLHDWLQGGAGDDLIYGGGGAGVDTADYSDATDYVTIDLNIFVRQDTHGSGHDYLMSIANLNGSAFDDVLRGGYGVNQLDGGAGADRLSGDVGDDRLFGGDGADLLDGGTGRDFLIGQAGDDQLNGGDDIDTAVFAGPRSAWTITTDGAVTTVRGPDGVDRLTAVEFLRFSDGLYDISGVLVAPTLPTTAGADQIAGTSGNDILYGGDGDDVINPGRGHDVIDGGAGTDTVVFVSSRGNYQMARHGDVIIIQDSSASYTLTGVERILFGDQTFLMRPGGGLYLTDSTANDQLIGDRDDDELIAGEGKDTLLGAAGDDRLSGGSGDDTLWGGAGDDWLIGGTGNDRIDGGDGLDTLEVSGAYGQYVLHAKGDGYLLVGPDGSDHLTAVELIRFGDGTVLDLARYHDDGPQILPGEPSGKTADDIEPLVLPGVHDPFDKGARVLLPEFSDGESAARLNLPPGSGAWTTDHWLF